jgi:hypothetical protein
MRLQISNECISASNGTPMPLHNEKTVLKVKKFCWWIIKFSTTSIRIKFSFGFLSKLFSLKLLFCVFLFWGFWLKLFGKLFSFFGKLFFELFVLFFVFGEKTFLIEEKIFLGFEKSFCICGVFSSFSHCESGTSCGQMVSCRSFLLR